MNYRQGTDELFDFKRIFRLLIGLVVLPTLLLSGFGILAIKNERAALEKRLRETYEDRSAQLERALLTRLAGASPDQLAEANTLLARLVRERFPEEHARFVLVPDSLQGADGRSLYEWLRQLSPSLPAWSELGADEAPHPVTSRVLPAPLSGYQLAVFLTDSDPVGDAVMRITIIYSSLMVLFLALVIIGVVVTARFVHREVRLSRLQTDFVSNVSHELRTPLTSIRMFIETLQLERARDEAEVRECLAIISEESDRLTRMIERILGWARMEAGRRIYTLQPHTVEELVGEALRAFQTQLFRDQLVIEEDLAPGLPPVMVDREALVEALLNLLNNALKYTGEHKVIKISAHLMKKQVAIEVSDNGIGIAPQDRKRVFERFFRADALLSRRTEGSGLGLSIVRHIVEAHNGRVLVESEVGVGSRFTLLLPPLGQPERGWKFWRHSKGEDA